MNIDSLLDLQGDIFAVSADGARVSGRVRDLSGDDSFVFVPVGILDVAPGRMVKITDGHDSVLAKLVERGDDGMLRMSLECYAHPGEERRQDVRIYDKIYYRINYLGPGAQRDELLPGAMDAIHTDKLLVDSFLKGRYGYPGADEVLYTREGNFNQGLWEVNRKLDLLIHMMLSNDFRELMNSPLRAVNVSASGFRFVDKKEYQVGDLLEVGFILPMVPLLYLRLVGEVLRIKPVTMGDEQRYSVSVRFLELDAEAKDDIIRYLFRRQREILRRRQE